MALTTVYPFTWPRLASARGDLSSSSALDAAADRQVQIGFIPKTGNLTHVGFMPRLVGTSESIDVEIQGVGLTNGDHDGTPLKTGTHAGAFSAGTYYEIALASSLAVTAGQFVAVVFKFTSFSAGNVTIAGMLSEPTSIPYGIANTAGSNTKSTTTIPMCALKYDDGSYGTLGLLPALSSTTVSTAFNSGSATNRRGNILQMQRSRRAIGAEIMMSMSAGATADVVLYNNAGTSLASFSLDGDAIGNTSVNRYRGFFDTTVTISASTNYRLCLVPTNTTNSTLVEYTFNSTAILNALHEGTNVYKTLYTSAAWDDAATTARCAISLICDQEDFSTGTSGVIGG